MSIWWTQCLLVAQTNINEGAGKQTESQVVLFFIFFQTLITCLWIIIDGSQVNGLKTEIHPSPSYFQSSGDRTHILFISSARSSSVHHGLLHTYIQAHFIRFFKFIQNQVKMITTMMRVIIVIAILVLLMILVLKMTKKYHIT